MKTLGNWCIAVTVLAWAVCGAVPSAAAGQTATIKTMTPILMGSSHTVQGRFDDLTPAARQLGLGQTTVTGNIRYYHLGSGGTRATVNWNSLSWTQGTTTNTRALSNPLTSQFTTSDKRVEPSTVLTVKGDLQGVSNVFSAMKSEAAKQQTTANGNGSNGGVQQGTQRTAQTTPYDFGSSGYPATTGTSTGNNTNGSNGVNTATTAWSSCAPRVDQAAGLVYLQAQQITTDSNGNVVKTGSCEDHGGTVPIEKDYSSCSYSYDFKDAKAYAQYTTYATINGQKMDISGCTIDTNKYVPLKTTYTGCGVQFDFANKVGIQQQQYYYIDSSGKTQDVGDCQNSSVTYPLTQTVDTCTPVVDSTNNLVFPQVRWEYTGNDGTVQYATQCEPESSTGTAIKYQYCSPKYDPDWDTSIVYVMQKGYYVGPDGTDHYITSCERDPNVSYPMKHDETKCGVTDDDAKLQTIWNANTYIQTPDDGYVQIQGCEQYQSPTPYTFMKTFDTTGSSFEAQGPSCGASGTWDTFQSILGTHGKGITSFTFAYSGATSRAQATSTTGYTSLLMPNEATYGVSVATFNQGLTMTAQRRMCPWLIQQTEYGTFAIEKKGNVYMRGDGTTYNDTQQWIVHLIDPYTP